MFASDFMQNAADLLVKCSKTVDTTGEKLFANDANCTSLIESIIHTLHFVFMHDSNGFINSHRFEILLQPIVNQLENELVLQNPLIKKQLPPCLAQLASAANDDLMWKQLNYQILLKTRHANSDVR